MKNATGRILLILGLAATVYATDTPSVKELIHNLQSEEVDQREKAAETLGKMGPDAAEAIGPLEKSLNDDFPYVRIRSAEALARIGPDALPALMRATKNVNTEVRAIAVTAVGRYGENDEAAVKTLTAALHDKELQVRGAAALALGNLGTSAQSAIPALEEATQDPNPSVAQDATRALNKIKGIKEIEETKTIGMTLHPTTSQTAAAAVPSKSPRPKSAHKKSVPAHAKTKSVKKGKTAAPSPPPPPTPEELMNRFQAELPVPSTGTTQAIIQRSSETACLLIQALQQSNTTFAQASADLLQQMGTPEAKKAVEAYEKRTGDKRITALIKDLRQEGKTSDEASVALVRLGAQAVQPVIPVLSDPKPANRRAAAKTLNRMGPAAAPATSTLVTALDDSDPEVRALSADALRKIGTPEAQRGLRFFSLRDWVHRILGYFGH